jgi:outer membrane lipoprotein-sorting protein
LLNQLKKIEPNLIKNNFINFKLINESNRINIYFNKNNLNLAGWKTTDIYQNEVLFEVKNIKKNQEIDKKKFILPELN